MPFLSTPRGLTGPGYAGLNNASYKSVQSVNASTGVKTDLYTCPTGKRAIVWVTGYNPTASTGSLLHYLKSAAANYYQMGSDSWTANNFITGNFPIGSLLLEAGEAYSFDPGIANININLRIIEFDASSPLKSAKLYGLASGNNTIYTCPSGKTVFPVDGVTFMPTSLNAGRIWCSFTATITITPYFVPNGQAVGTTTQIKSPASPTLNQVYPIGYLGTMVAGDSAVLNCSIAASTGVGIVYYYEA